MSNKYFVSNCMNRMFLCFFYWKVKVFSFLFNFSTGLKSMNGLVICYLMQWFLSLWLWSLESCEYSLGFHQLSPSCSYLSLSKMSFLIAINLWEFITVNIFFSKGLLNFTDVSVLSLTGLLSFLCQQDFLNRICQVSLLTAFHFLSWPKICKQIC